jgi:predicted ATPase
VSYGKATAYFPVIDLLKRYAHVEDGDDTRTIRAKVTGQVLTLDAALQEALPALLGLLDALPDDSPFLTLDPPQRRQRTLDALKRLLLRESQEQPLLLVFEDLHWIDSETQTLLNSLVESLPTSRLLLLVSYRPEYQHGWGSKTYYTQLRLDPLPPVSADEFLQALLGDDTSLKPLTTMLIARTEGNPFFLEESVRTLAELGGLVGTRGAYRLGQALVESPGPDHCAGRAGGTHRPVASRGEAPPADGCCNWHKGALAAAARHCRRARGSAPASPDRLAERRVPL